MRKVQIGKITRYGDAKGQNWYVEIVWQHARTELICEVWATSELDCLDKAEFLVQSWNNNVDITETVTELILRE